MTTELAKITRIETTVYRLAWGLAILFTANFLVTTFSGVFILHNRSSVVELQKRQEKSDDLTRQRIEEITAERRDDHAKTRQKIDEFNGQREADHKEALGVLRRIEAALKAAGIGCR